MKFDLGQIKFNLPRIKFNLAQIEFDLAQMTFNPAKINFTSERIKFNLARRKFTTARIEFDLAQFNCAFRPIEPVGRASLFSPAIPANCRATIEPLPDRHGFSQVGRNKPVRAQARTDVSSL